MTIIKKFDPGSTSKHKFPKKYVALIGLSLLLLTIIEIWVNNTAVTYGERFAEFSLLQKTITTENQILENEIAKSASLRNLASKSAALGFSKVESIQYIR